MRRGVRGARAGQAMLEYVLAFAALLVVIAVMGCAVAAALKAEARTERLVKSDYP